MYDNLLKSNQSKITLDQITDPVTLATILSGIKPADVNAMPVNKKVQQVVNILNASITNKIYMNSQQVLRKKYFLKNSSYLKF